MTASAPHRTRRGSRYRTAVGSESLTRLESKTVHKQRTSARGFHSPQPDPQGTSTRIGLVARELLMLHRRTAAGPDASTALHGSQVDSTPRRRRPRASSRSLRHPSRLGPWQALACQMRPDRVDGLECKMLRVPDTVRRTLVVLILIIISCASFAVHVHELVIQARVGKG